MSFPQRTTLYMEVSLYLCENVWILTKQMFELMDAFLPNSLFLEETDSTNSYLARLLASGERLGNGFIVYMKGWATDLSYIAGSRPMDAGK